MNHEWKERWFVAGIEIPLPPSRAEDRESGGAGRWEKTFKHQGLATKAAQIWDDWAATLGLRTLTSRGPHEMGMFRVYDDGGDLGVTISACHMPGDSVVLVLIHIARRSALPRSVLKSGCLETAELSIPLPAGAIPDGHEDRSDVGGEDCHDFTVASFTVAAMLALYLPWTSARGFELRDRVDGLGDCSLFFRHRDGLDFDVYYGASRRGGEPPTLRLALRRVEDEA